MSSYTNEHVTYFNWHNGEPNGGRNENCVEIYFHNGQWNDQFCDEKLSYVCKIGNTTSGN